MTLGSVGTCSPPPGEGEGTGSDGQEQLGLCSRRSRSIHAQVLTPCSLMTWDCRATLVTASSHLLPIMTLRGHTRGALVLTSHRMDPGLEGGQGLTPTRGQGTKAFTLASGPGSFCPTRPRASPGGLPRCVVVSSSSSHPAGRQVGSQASLCSCHRAEG